MKKWMAFALCALLLCAPLGALTQDAELEDELTQRTMDVLAALVEGNFEEISAQFDEAMRAAVSDEALESGWSGLLDQLGEPVSVGAIEADAQTRSACAQIVHESGSAVLMLAYDEAGDIASMYIAPQAVSAPAQERALPEGVTAEEVVLFAGTQRELGGELLRPAGADEATPYVVLAHGSGPSDMDETVAANKPFRDLAYDLATLGVGSLRFDKITYAHPEYPVQTVEQEYGEPVAEALRVLREATGAQRVYLVGHSEGGTLTPYLVARCGFDGGVALAGTPKQLWEISYAQNLAVIALLPQEQQETLRAQVEAEREKALTLAQMTDEEAAAVTVFGMSGTYLAHMARMDQAQMAEECGKPFLFLWGEADFQVDREAFEAWRERLGDDERFAYRTYPGLNHLFMPAEEDDGILNAQAAYQRPAQMDAQVAEDIAAWMAAL